MLVSTVFGCLGWLGLVPSWLAGLVVARDAAQIAATFAHRARSFGWAWPGLAAFADVDGAPGLGRGGGGAAGGGGGVALAGGSRATDCGVSGDSGDSSGSSSSSTGSAASSSNNSSNSGCSGGGDVGDGNVDAGADAGAVAAEDAGAMPRIRPLMLSKVNTALAFALAAAAVAREWQGAPSAGAVELLGLAVGATTAASGLAYLWLFSQGRLLK